jgi:hypothetical protein
MSEPTPPSIHSIVEQVQALSAEDRLLLITRLTEMIRVDLHQARNPQSWGNFLKATYGSLSHDPIERWEDDLPIHQEVEVLD